MQLGGHALPKSSTGVKVALKSGEDTQLPRRPPPPGPVLTPAARSGRADRDDEPDWEPCDFTLRKGQQGLRVRFKVMALFCRPTHAHRHTHTHAGYTGDVDLHLHGTHACSGVQRKWGQS